MAQYAFVTRGLFDAPVDRVWRIITDVERLTEWWPGFRRAAVRGGDRTLRVGQTVDCILQAPMRYRLAFTLEITDLDPPRLMRLRSSGDLVGMGQWDLRERGLQTDAAYTWQVDLNRPLLAWLNRLPGVRAVLSRNHEVVMTRGFESLRRLLRAEAPAPRAV